MANKDCGTADWKEPVIMEITMPEIRPDWRGRAGLDTNARKEK